MGRRPIMEMVQQLFKLQISLRFSVGLSVCPLVLLFLPCCPCHCPVFTPHFFPIPLCCSLLNPCYDYLSYLPGERTNSIRGTCLPNALPLSVLAICGAASPTTLSPARSISTESSSVLPCWSSLQAVELSQAVAGPSPALALYCSRADGPSGLPTVLSSLWDILRPLLVLCLPPLFFLWFVSVSLSPCICVCVLF